MAAKEIVSNRKTILISGSLQKTVPSEDSILYAIIAKLCQMGDTTKSHDPSAKNQKIGAAILQPQTI
jgi:hypothetical protein